MLVCQCPAFFMTCKAFFTRVQYDARTNGNNLMKVADFIVYTVGPQLPFTADYPDVTRLSWTSSLRETSWPGNTDRTRVLSHLQA